MELDFSFIGMTIRPAASRCWFQALYFLGEHGFVPFFLAGCCWP